MEQVDQQNGQTIAGPMNGGVGRGELLATLERWGISQTTHDHRPVFTVEEGRDLKTELIGGHSKNLFLKDKKGIYRLVVAHCDTQIDLVSLGRHLGAKGRLSFASAERLGEILKIMPGAVTPFTLLNESAKIVSEIIFDQSLLVHDPIWFHPLENAASTAISPADLRKFVQKCGFEPQELDLRTL